MFSSIQGKSVLVTGASRGIGLAIARRFARAGAQVSICARTADGLDTALALLRQEGGQVHGMVADVSDPDAVSALIAHVAHQQDGLDMLCCNAGVFPSVKLQDMRGEDWDHVLAVNVKGNFLCVQAALPWLRRAEYGRVILTSSITGPITGYPGWAHYGASKAAQLGFMRTAAIELARDGITINAVLPGNVLTEGLQDLGADYRAAMAAAVPLGRLGDLEEVANAALFFASREASYITGQALVVDGGQILPESLDALK